MENPELLLLELEEFSKRAEQDDLIPSNLENFIEYVSKTGTYVFPWVSVRKLYLKKLQNVINNLPSSLSMSGIENLNSSSSFSLNNTSNNESINIQLIKERIVERMQSFTSAPFTIQRISELLLKPTNHYNRVDKYLRGLEKCIMVVTTVDPQGSKIFLELGLTNGTMSNSISPAATPTRPLTPISQSNMNESNSTASCDNKTIEDNAPTSTVSSVIDNATTIDETTSIYIEEQTIVSNDQIEMTVVEKIETDEPIITEESTNENVVTNEMENQPIAD